MGALVAACDGPPATVPLPQPSNVTQERREGEVHDRLTRAEVLDEIRRLPPILREQFESESGQREFFRALEDKRLLAAEARRRNLAEDPAIAKQLRELEERLTIQKLVEHEERQDPITDEEARAWFEANKESLKQPPRSRLARVSVSFPPAAPPSARQAARTKAERFRKRLLAGEDPLKVGTEGDGPERVRGGDLGFLKAGEHPDRRVDRAIPALAGRGDVSDVLEGPDDYAVFIVLDRRDARIPSYDEVKTEVRARMEPQRKRQVFNQLIQKLRKSSASQASALP